MKSYDLMFYYTFELALLYFEIKDIIRKILDHDKNLKMSDDCINNFSLP